MARRCILFLVVLSSIFICVKILKFFHFWKCMSVCFILKNVNPSWTFWSMEHHIILCTVYRCFSNIWHQFCILKATNSNICIWLLFCHFQVLFFFYIFLWSLYFSLNCWEHNIDDHLIFVFQIFNWNRKMLQVVKMIFPAIVRLEVDNRACC